jgi:glycosyltransferase involved in cell wall biosynthesis
VKIAIFSKPFWPSIGGVETTTRILCRTLIDLGHSPIVLTATQLDGQGEICEGASIIRRTSFLSIQRVLRKVDMVVINGGFSVPVVLAAFLWKRPVIVWHQMVGCNLPTASDYVGRLRNLMGILLMRYVRLHVGVSSECLASKCFPSSLRQVVVYNPVALELSDAAKATDSIQIRGIDVLFVGRMIKGKGVIILAQALQRLDSEGVTMTVCFVGSGPELETIKEIVNGLHNVKCMFSGSLGLSGLVDVYSRSRCLVLPSTTHPEGMPLVIAEALTFGLPVIGSNQAAIVETIGDAGLSCPQEDVQQLADTIHLLKTNAALWTQLSAAASKRAAIFSYENFSQAVKHVLELTLKP